MCWLGDFEDKKIATEDIKTKKILDFFKGEYYGYYQEWFNYKLGKEYVVEISPRKHSIFDKKCVIDAGFHSYAWDFEMTLLCGGDIRVKSHVGGETTFTNHGGYGDHKIVVVECTIPKGTVYWENRVGEIVSEKLIIEDEIEIKDDCNFC